jgi:hypothetical protein
VAAKIKAYQQDEVILGYRTILNEEKLGVELVRAVIEVKITPERGGGFDRLAVFGMGADQTRQVQQGQSARQGQAVRRPAFRQAGAVGLTTTGTYIWGVNRGAGVASWLIDSGDCRQSASAL